jgi:hypothetical protein
MWRDAVWLGHLRREARGTLTGGVESSWLRHVLSPNGMGVLLEALVGLKDILGA